MKSKLTLILLFLFISVISLQVKAQLTEYDFPEVNQLPVVEGLPDPFTMVDGSRVKTLRDWEEQKKYLRDMLLYYQYGFFPPDSQAHSAEIDSTTSILNGKATEISLTLTLSSPGTPSLRIDLSIPTQGEGPFPVVITGDHEWYRAKGLELATDRGYIVADFYRTDFDPDLDDNTDGIQPYFPTYDWATVSAWAWGYYRVVDYLLTRSDVDKEKIIFTGHSRGGKAALLAGAMDDRAALVVPNGSGAGGCGCYKYMQGEAETLADITDPERFDYWFQPRLRDFSNDLGKLPFDQHFLKALVAPRALLCTDALGDIWANPWGTQQTQEGVREVYRFFGVEEKVGVHFREGEHSHNTVDWGAMLDFADFIFHQTPLPTSYFAENFSRADSLFSWEPPAPLVWGCMDSTYQDFNPLATAHDSQACIALSADILVPQQPQIVILQGKAHFEIVLKSPKTQIEVLDIQGAVLFSSQNDFKTRYKFDRFKPGMYIVHARNKKASSTKRFLLL